MFFVGCNIRKKIWSRSKLDLKPKTPTAISVQRQVQHVGVCDESSRVVDPAIKGWETKDHDTIVPSQKTKRQDVGRISCETVSYSQEDVGADGVPFV